MISNKSIIYSTYKRHHCCTELHREALNSKSNMHQNMHQNSPLVLSRARP
jgi:hypothetical protein